MFTVTEGAGYALRSIMNDAAIQRRGMRMSKRPSTASEDGSQPLIRLDMVDEAQEGDAMVVAPGGVPLFIESRLAPKLGDRVLDGTLNDEGQPEFVLDTQ